MSISTDKDDDSDNALLTAGTDKKIVMAEQITQDVVKEAQSMGVQSPIDATATTTNTSAGDGEPFSASITSNSKPSDLSTASKHALNSNIRGVDGEYTDTAKENNLGLSNLDSHENDQRNAVFEDSKGQLINGDSGEHSASEDASTHILADASGGSDTDISRPGSTDPLKETIGGHLRSNSMKKPTAFKSVSVTKNFLAKSAVTTPSPRPGEKAAPAGQTNAPVQQTAKPRLVAKSGSGNVPRSGLSKMNGAGSGPDASKVWNKNQPVPPPPPKQFTDEELKQQYGIHLATRLQADEAGKEAKWADIDDDEDDWAPDTVEWMDGTKSTVTAVENQPPPQEEPKPVVLKKETDAESKPPPTLTTNSQGSISTAGTKTILKPGAHTLSNSNKAGLVLKGQPEKPTLVAKPSSSNPVKSPWAQLPPVDKVSPVQIVPPVQSPPARFGQQDPHGFHALPPVSAATKELAPDDFNRSWRDERGSTKELFNSHSGRYEPVSEMRRGSIRDRDNGLRQPSVLQRPSQGGPAEPSAAFQTSRSSADVPTWGRRRNSSNVSGGSGRRMSIDRRGQEVAVAPFDIQRRGSQSIASDMATPSTTQRPVFPQRAHPSDQGSSTTEQHQPWTQQSPNVSHAQPTSPYGSVISSGPAETSGTTEPVESPVEVQNRLMREKLERARLQKQFEKEKEAEEEAARKERLRKKLEAMGMGMEKLESKKEASPVRLAEKSPQKDKAVPAPIQSPPKPPVPTSEGEVAQYGMMKVHQPHPVKKMGHTPPPAEPKLKPVDAAPKQVPSPVKSQTAEVPAKITPPMENRLSPSELKQQHNRFDNRASSQPPQSKQPQGAQLEGPLLKSSLPGSQAWKSSSQNDNRSAWTAIPNTSATNVWGPPQNKDRALGNGTFDTAYRGPPASHPQPAQSHINQPGPIGLPSIKYSPSQSHVAPNQSFNQPNMHMPMAEGPAQQQRLRDTRRSPGPIAPPTAPATSWGNFATQIKMDDEARAKKMKEEQERHGGVKQRVELREKFYAGEVGVDHADRPDAVQVHTGSGTATAPLIKVKAPQETVARGIAPESHVKVEANLPSQGEAVATGQSGKASRFFPRSHEAASQPQTAANKFDSPPPPEVESHPVYEGNTIHPNVKMPPPTPRVKLPTVTSPQPAPATPSAAAAAPAVVMPHIGARPISATHEWQARFNGLLYGSATRPLTQTSGAQAPVAATTSSNSNPALAVTSSSKAPLDVPQHARSATVSLPASAIKKPFTVDNSSEVISRVTAEEALLEDREFGSLPVIKVPNIPHLAANEPRVDGPTSRPNSRFQRPVDAVSVSSIGLFEDAYSRDGIEIYIRLPKMALTISKTLLRSLAHGQGRKNSSTLNKNKRTSYNGGPKTNTQTPRPRKPSSNYQGQGTSSQSSTPRSTTGNSGPRPSAGTNSWNNSRSNSNNWNKRSAPGVVH